MRRRQPRPLRRRGRGAADVTRIAATVVAALAVTPAAAIPVAAAPSTATSAAPRGGGASTAG